MGEGEGAGGHSWKVGRVSVRPLNLTMPSKSDQGGSEKNDSVYIHGPTASSFEGLSGALPSIL